MLAKIFSHYGNAVEVAAEGMGLMKEWQQEVVDQIEEVWTSEKGSAFKTLLRLSEDSHTLATQLFCQTYDWSKQFYTPIILPCGRAMPQMRAFMSKAKVKGYQLSVLDSFGIECLDLAAQEMAAPAESCLEDEDEAASVRLKKSGEKSTCSITRDVIKYVRDRTFQLGDRLELDDAVEVS